MFVIRERLHAHPVCQWLRVFLQNSAKSSGDEKFYENGWIKIRCP